MLRAYIVHILLISGILFSVSGLGLASGVEACLSCPGQPTATYTVDNDSGCAGLTVTFTDGSVIGHPSDSFNDWIWDFGDNTTSSLQNPVHQFTTSGNYIVKLTVKTAFGCSASYSKTIYVYPFPLAVFTPIPSQLFIPQDFLTLVNDSKGGSTYSWDFGDGSTATGFTPKHVYNQTGTFSVKLVVSTFYGCKDSAEKQVIVSGDVIVPNAFTPNSLVEPAASFSETSLDNDIFHPYVRGAKEFSFSIYNRWGELLFDTTQLNEGWNGYYKNEVCPMGVYTWKIKITFDDGRVYDRTGSVNLIR